MKNLKESSIVKGSVTNVTDVIDVTNVINVTYPLVTRVTRNTELCKYLFSDSTLDRILELLVTESKGFTYDEIAKVVGKSPATIKMTISRNIELFDIKRPNGKICYAFLLRITIDKINEKINQYNENLKKKEENEKNKFAQEMEVKNIDLSMINFLKISNPKRNGIIIIIDIDELIKFDLKLSYLFFEETENFIEKLKDYYGELYQFEFINIPTTNFISIEGIRAKNINQLITIEGRVVSLSEVKPMTKIITFECPSCGSVMKLNQNYIDGVIKEPNRCSCGRRGRFKIIEEYKEDSCFLQIEDLQDKTDNPQSQRIKAILFNSLCKKDKIKIFTPGNEVKCNGIFKEVPIYKFGRKSTLTNKIIEIISAEPIEKDIDLENLSEEDINLINNLSAEINEKGLSIIDSSFAPEVYGYDYIKEAVILQLCNKRNNKKESQVRNKSNILLIGDPGVAKSVLCDFAISISSGSRKAVGGGSSAVGITASVIKEEESMGGYRVEPGAMILAKDLLFLDELNNLQEEDKPKLQEGMSEQTVSINKANLHVQMKVSAGLLAVANPKYGTFKDNDKETIEEQFNIPSPILNRFDSIFVVRDKVDEDGDMKIAEKMINRHNKKLNPIYEKNLLKKFFAYIKSFPEPEIDLEIQKKFQEVYSYIRKNNNSKIKINPRFLESLIRMSTASAKIRQSNKVENKDIETAMKIISQSQFKIDCWEKIELSRLTE